MCREWKEKEKKRSRKYPEEIYLEDFRDRGVNRQNPTRWTEISVLTPFLSVHRFFTNLCSLSLHSLFDSLALDSISNNGG